jgi:hypothetical protein
MNDNVFVDIAPTEQQRNFQAITNILQAVYFSTGQAEPWISDIANSYQAFGWLSNDPRERDRRAGAAETKINSTEVRIKHWF